MQQSAAISSAEKRALRSRHPLYTKLSGDVVWGLLEEQGLDQDACGMAMDAFIADMHAVLDAMDRLEKGQADRFVIRAKGPACDACAALADKAVPTTNPGWRELLPPFAVGCAMTCQVLSEDEARHAGLALITPDAKPSRPAAPLLCPLLDAAKER